MRMQKMTSRRVLDFLGVKLVSGKDLSCMSEYRAYYNLDNHAQYICSSSTGGLLWSTKKLLSEEDAAVFMLKQKS